MHLNSSKYKIHRKIILVVADNDVSELQRGVKLGTIGRALEMLHSHDEVTHEVPYGSLLHLILIICHAVHLMVLPYSERVSTVVDRAPIVQSASRPRSAYRNDLLRWRN